MAIIDFIIISNHRYIALLSVKLAKLARNALIASVHSDAPAMNSHRDLLAMFGFETRNIICYTKVRGANLVRKIEISYFLYCVIVRK
jgi:hypothetical protein